MLSTLFITVALVGGGVFGFYASHVYHTEQNRKKQKDLVESLPTDVLEEEPNKRGTRDKSAYR